jgi:two-component system cell cycle sensor histidine kinase/response regulator CckA
MIVGSGSRVQQGPSPKSNSLVDLDSLQEAYIRLDGKLRFTFANRAAECLLGIAPHDLIGRTPWEVRPESAGTVLEQQLRRAQVWNIVVSFENHYEPWDRWYAITAMPDSCGGLIVHFSDITEKKAAEKTMTSLVTAIEQTEEQVVITDLSGTIQYCNPAFEMVTGYSKSDAIGQNSRILKSGKHGAEYYQEMWKTLGAGKVWKGNVTNRKKNGPLYEEESTISPIRDSSGQVTGFVAVKRDITERQELMRQFLQAQKMESVGRLAGGVAHDFNNLLTVINGYADFVATSLGQQDSLWPSVNQIRKAGERAASLTKQLLAFSRKQIFEPKMLDLNVTIRDFDRMLERLIGENIKLTTRLDPVLGQVLADPEQVHQVLMNLVVNAHDAMPDGGNLDISTLNVDVSDHEAAFHPQAKPGLYVMIAVTDNGTGMDEETRQRIFEPFFTTKGPERGTGLGLSTVYGIVQQSGGWIDVSSDIGVGTSFKLYFPRIDEPPCEAQCEPHRIKGAFGDETILIVEDQEYVRQYVKSILEAYSYRVLAAANGDEAVAVAANCPGEIHLLLTDVVLPGMNGKEVSERLKAMQPSLKVLFMSGYSPDVIAHRGVLDSGVAYIPKPFTPGGLTTKIRELLGAMVWSSPAGS